MEENCSWMNDFLVINQGVKQSIVMLILTKELYLWAERGWMGFPAHLACSLTLTAGPRMRWQLTERGAQSGVVRSRLLTSERTNFTEMSGTSYAALFYFWQEWSPTDCFAGSSSSLQLVNELLLLCFKQIYRSDIKPKYTNKYKLHAIGIKLVIPHFP